MNKSQLEAVRMAFTKVKRSMAYHPELTAGSKEIIFKALDDTYVSLAREQRMSETFGGEEKRETPEEYFNRRMGLKST